LLNQTLEHSHITLLVPGLVYRGFRDEGGVCEALVVKQAAEGFHAHFALADVLMAV
jgi:hypothetical protein